MYIILFILGFSQLFETLWLVLDQNEDQSIDYGEFHRAFLGEMNERRKTYVRKVRHLVITEVFNGSDSNTGC